MQGKMAGLLAHSAAQRAMTHCKRGHEFTPENTRINREGHRKCRKCARERDTTQKERNARRRALAANLPLTEEQLSALIIDPVALYRAAGGDRGAYDALTTRERAAFWNWLYADHPEDFDAIYTRLMGGMSPYRYRRNAAARVAKDNPVMPDPDEMESWSWLWNPPQRHVSWHEHLGVEVDKSGHALMLGATKVDLTPGYKWNKSRFGAGVR